MTYNKVGTLAGPSPISTPHEHTCSLPFPRTGPSYVNNCWFTSTPSSLADTALRILKWLDLDSKFGLMRPAQSQRFPCQRKKKKLSDPPLSLSPRPYCTPQNLYCVGSTGMCTYFLHIGSCQPRNTSYPFILTLHTCRYCKTYSIGVKSNIQKRLEIVNVWRYSWSEKAQSLYVTTQSYLTTPPISSKIVSTWHTDEHGRQRPC